MGAAQHGVQELTLDVAVQGMKAGPCCRCGQQLFGTMLARMLAPNCMCGDGQSEVGEVYPQHIAHVVASHSTVLVAVLVLAAVPVLQLLWAEGGLKRFYRGFTPCLIRAAPANGAMLYTVDTVTNMLNKQS